MGRKPHEPLTVHIEIVKEPCTTAKELELYQEGIRLLAQEYLNWKLEKLAREEAEKNGSNPEETNSQNDKGEIENE